MVVCRKVKFFIDCPIYDDVILSVFIANPVFTDIIPVLENLIGYVRIYFPLDATREILAKFRPLLCLQDTTMTKGCTLLALFLPSRLSAEEHKTHGHALCCGWLR